MSCECPILKINFIAVQYSCQQGMLSYCYTGTIILQTKTNVLLSGNETVVLQLTGINI